MENLELNHTYLLKYLKYETISILQSVTVLMITDKAYYLRWNRGINSSDDWVEKTYVNINYSIFEDISDIIASQKIDEDKTLTKTEWIQCHLCNGFGTIPDKESTTGTKPCPLCHGSKVTPKITEFS